MTNKDLHKTIAKQVRATGTSFYWPMHLQQRKYRQALFTIYMYCRVLDDVADVPDQRDAKIRKLSHWRDEIDCLFSGTLGTGPTGSPLIPALLETIRQFKLPKAPFVAVIEGMEADVNGPIIAPDWKSLRIYCHQVAGSVGNLCLAVWGWRGEQADLFAESTGQAFQLTNILRDIKDDAHEGRVYLPREVLENARINSRQPVDILRHPNLADACGPVIDLADQRFKIARSLWKESSVKTARPAWVMLELYRALFDEVVRTGFGPDRPRARLSTARKLQNLIPAYISA
tara:strand:+ start:824 stop:1684 length:861 start_codon:yes stop_codon:yes gene_type:complete